MNYQIEVENKNISYDSFDYPTENPPDFYEKLQNCLKMVTKTNLKEIFLKDFEGDFILMSSEESPKEVLNQNFMMLPFTKCKYFEILKENQCL